MNTLNIGSRREVFWDDYLIDKERTTVSSKVCPIDNIFVYRDENPDCPTEELYKTVGSGSFFDGKFGLYLFTSADGYDFKVARYVTGKGAFDTCNTLHYIDGRYVCFVRSYHDYKAPANETQCMMNDLYHVPTPGKMPV